MSKVFIALGSPQKFVKLGSFKVTTKNGAMDIYYNIDLGHHRAKMFDADTGVYKDMRKLHQSFHHSGQGHMKEAPGMTKLLVGQISDSSVLNTIEMEPLILGIESFYFDSAAEIGDLRQDTVFLRPLADIEQYSILWFFVPSTFPSKIHPRLLYVNLWGSQDGYNICQTAALLDVAISAEMETLLNVDGWEIRALFLKPLLPALAQSVCLSHPNGTENPWRACAFLDAHLPISHILRLEAVKKRPIYSTEPYQIPLEAATPNAWVKYK